MDLDDLVRLGLGCIHLSPSDFWGMDFVDLCLAVEGHAEMIENVERMEWERTRWMTCMLLSPHGKPGKRLQPRDLIRFPWDNLQRKVTEDEQRKGEALLLAIAKKNTA